MAKKRQKGKALQTGASMRCRGSATAPATPRFGPEGVPVPCLPDEFSLAMAQLNRKNYCIPIPVHHSEIMPSDKPGFHIGVPLPHTLRALYTLQQRAYKKMKGCEASCWTASSETVLTYRELRHALACNRFVALRESFEGSAIEYYVKIGRLDPSLDLRTSAVYVNVLRNWTVYFMAGPRRPDRRNQ